MDKKEMTYFDIARLASNGNDDAYEYLVLMGKVFRVWDDAYDGDKLSNKEMVNDVFCSILFGDSFGLFGNDFYKRHKEKLDALVFVAWNAWQDSNEWEGHPDQYKRMAAWFIRDFVNEIDCYVAFLCGGISHARKFSLVMREWALGRLKADEPLLF